MGLINQRNHYLKASLAITLAAKPLLLSLQRASLAWFSSFGLSKAYLL